MKMDHILKNRTSNRWIAIRIFVTAYLICLFFMDSSPHGLFTSKNRFQYLAYSLVHNQTIDITNAEKLYGQQVEAYDFAGKRILMVNPGVGILAAPIYGLSSFFNMDDIVALIADNDAILVYHGLLFALSVNAPLFAVFVVSIWLMLNWLGLTKRLALWLSICLGWGSMAAYYFTSGTNIHTAAETSLTTLALLFVVGFEQKKAIKAPLFMSGLFLGIATLVNVPAVITTLFVLLYLYYRHRSEVMSFLLGLVPGALILLVYQWIALGNPLMDIPFAYFQSKGLYQTPSDIAFVDVAIEFLVGWKLGFIWYFPMLICLILGLRKSKVLSALAVLCWSLIIVHWLFATWYTHLWIQTEEMLTYFSWQAITGPGGPRYLLPAMPFIAILISRLDFRSIYLRSWIVWAGIVGLCLNIPILMYPAGGPVYRSFALMMKNGFNIPIAKVLSKLVHDEINNNGAEMTYFLTWLFVLLAIVYVIWSADRFRDWLFKGYVAKGSYDT